VTLLHESPLISIAAATGGAYAGGAGLLAACDLVLADEKFQLGFPEVRRGLVAAIVWGVLSRKVRDGDLRELFLVAEPITAARAQMIGLVQYIEPSQQVLAKAYRVATSILAGGPNAVRESKLLLNHDRASVDFQHLQELHERVKHSAEAHEGLMAFKERRKPNWCKSNSEGAH
jgi:methylglutaconyl-CoA hydratase